MKSVRRGCQALGPSRYGNVSQISLKLGNECLGLKEFLQKMCRVLLKYKFQINKDFLAKYCLLSPSTLAAQPLHHASAFPSQQLEQISLPAPCAI